MQISRIPWVLHNFGEHCKWNLLPFWVGSYGIQRMEDTLLLISGVPHNSGEHWKWNLVQIASWVFIGSRGDEEDAFFWITGQFFTIMQETILKWVPYTTNAVGMVCTMGWIPREQVICKYAIDKRKNLAGTSPFNILVIDCMNKPAHQLCLLWQVPSVAWNSQKLNSHSL